jgi:hypothetical protein
MTTLTINSDAAIRALKAPVTGKVDYRDKGMPGLSLRVSHAGTKTWRLVGRLKGQAKQELFSLGEYARGTPGHVNLSDARQLAEQYKAELRQGINPRDRLADYDVLLFTPLKFFIIIIIIKINKNSLVCFLYAGMLLLSS